MIGRPLRIEWDEDDPAALKEAYHSQRDLAGHLIRSGWQIKAAAEAVGVHYRSAQRWVEWYRSGGLDEVVSRRMGGVGQPRYLNSDQEERLVEEVRSGRSGPPERSPTGCSLWCEVQGEQHIRCA